MMTDKKPYISDKLDYEPTIMIYDRASSTKLLVTMEELRENLSYHTFYIYEGLGANKTVAQYLKEQQKLLLE